VTALADGAAGPPVDAVRGAGHELLVDQVPAQRAVVVEDLPEDLVDHGFGYLRPGSNACTT
jgi:hypothetical protein